MTSPEPRRADRIGWSIVAAACLIAWALLLSGCSSSRHVVDEQSAVVTVRPDTVVSSVQPLPRADVATMPVEVREYRTPNTSHAAPVTAIVVDRRDPKRQAVQVRTNVGAQTFRLPATGEVLVAEAQADSTLVASVGGKQIDIVAQERDLTWWGRQTRGLACVGALCILALLAFIACRVR